MGSQAWWIRARTLVKTLTLPIIPSAFLWSCAVSAPDPMVTAPDPTTEDGAVQPPEPSPAPPRKVALEDMARYTPSATKGIFGTPSLQRAEGDMTVLQFTSSTCISDMVFNAAKQLIHVEARAKSGAPIEIQPCLDSFPQRLPMTDIKAATPDS